MNVFDIIGYVLLSIAVLLGAALLLLIILILTTSVKAYAEYDGEVRLKVKYLFFTFVKLPESPSRIRKKKRKEQKKKKKEEKKQIKELKKREKLRIKNRQAEHLKTPAKKSPPKSVSEIGKTGPVERTASPSKSEAPKTQGEAPKPQNPTPQTGQPQDAAKSVSGNAVQGKEKKKSEIDFKAAMQLISSAKPHIKRLFKKIRFDGVLIDILVGGEDAAKTAISYGVHCSAVYGLIEFLKQTVSFKAERISIKADFDLPKTDYYAKGKVKLKVSTLLRCLLWFFGSAAKELGKNSTSTGKQNQVKKQPLKKAG